MDDEEEQPLGWVPLDGRGSLPFALVHGESLVAAASWALGEAGVQLYDASVSFDQLRESGRALVLHDPLCPLTPVDHIVDSIERCASTGSVVIGFRAVTDTVKRADGENLGETVDRSGLRSVASPVVIPATVLAGLVDLDTSDFAVLAATLADLGEVVWLEAPTLARRIHDEPELRILEALSRSLV
ncbi:MAG TPA: 2-C-methyl-D-erythritol 4-phosphate cytidylyltransferase [Marmoricola sp.]|jgi:2-C-methyl-D-erythritol 4-phosphate cytidylyltransferase|nr:2-C-methyl-D-erythritol 4-phosphate cytidylyltransferase [Marmoricola sp.]